MIFGSGSLNGILRGRLAMEQKGIASVLSAVRPDEGRLYIQFAGINLA
jgi:hypothetical protein